MSGIESSPSYKNAISVHNVSKSILGKPIITNLNLNVRKGSIHGYLGPNGAGKTTTLKLIAGYFQPDEGTVKSDGALSFMTDTPQLYWEMLVEDFLLFLYQIQTFEFDRSLGLEKVRRVMERVKLDNKSRSHIFELSKGYQQKVSLGAALMKDPDILLLDEPTNGLDPHAIIDFRNILIDMKGKQTVIFSSHQLNEVEKICDDLTFINDGRVIESLSIQDLRLKHLSKARYFARSLKSSPEFLSAIKEVQNISLEKHFFIESAHNQNVWAFEFQGQNQQETLLIELFVQHHLDLIEFKRNEIQLEEIFKSIHKAL